MIGSAYFGQPYFGQGAPTLAPPQVVSVAQAAETDAAQVLTVVTSTAREAIVSWAELAKPVGAASSTVLGQAIETDTAQALGTTHFVPVDRAYEQGALYPATSTPGEVFPLSNSGALPISATPSFIIGQATETDLAQAIGANVAIGQAVETQLAQAITEVKGDVLGQATETDTAQSLAGGNVREAIVSWAEIALPSGTPITVLGQAQETELAQTVTPSQGGTPRVAAAGLIFMWGDPVSLGQIVVLGQATETETPQPLTAKKTVHIGIATSGTPYGGFGYGEGLYGGYPGSDFAQPITVFQSLSLGIAVETDTAQAITVAGGGDTIPIGQVFETDVAQPITWKRVRLVTQVLETDQALAIEALGGFDLRPLDCDDLNLEAVPDFAALYPSNLTFPSDMTYPSGGSDNLDDNLDSETCDDLVLVPA